MSLMILLATGLISTTSTGTRAQEFMGDVTRQMLTDVALPDIPGHKITAVTVRLSPGTSVPAHRHEGFIFVYVLAGSVQSQLDEDQPVLYATGESWIERSGVVHTVTQNISETDTATVLAVFVGKNGAKLTNPN